MYEPRWNLRLGPWRGAGSRFLLKRHLEGLKAPDIMALTRATSVAEHANWLAKPATKSQRQNNVFCNAHLHPDFVNCVAVTSNSDNLGIIHVYFKEVARGTVSIHQVLGLGIQPASVGHLWHFVRLEFSLDFQEGIYVEAPNVRSNHKIHVKTSTDYSRGSVQLRK